MKLLVLFALATVFAVPEKWIDSCTSNPSVCQEKIVKLSQQEREAIAYNKARVSAAQDVALKAEEDSDRVTEAIIKAHHMDKLPAAHSTHFGTMGGTCMGSIHFNDSGYIVYTPASDITQCGEYK